MEKSIDHSTNLKAIREQLIRGWRITVQSVLQSVGTQEARTYIAILRKDPELKIKDRWISKNGKHFKEYFLDVHQKVA